MKLRQNSRVFIIVSILAVLIAGYYAGYLDFFTSRLSGIFYRPQYEVAKLALATDESLSAALMSKKQLLERNIEQKTQINDLLYQLENLKTVQKENQDLRELLSFKGSTDKNLVTGNIIYHVNSETAREVILDRGSSDGLKSGYPVIVGRGTLIGRLDQVSLTKSTVKLTIDNTSQILATLSGSDYKIAGSIAGAQGNSLTLNLIPKNVVVRPRQLVTTNGFQEYIPSNLVLGKIISLQESPNEIFNSAIVEPAYQIEELTIATVILP